MASHPLVSHSYRFGPFEIDPVERVLFRNQEALPLTPKVFDLLLLLVENGGHVVVKERLMQAIWPDSFVEEGNLTQNISMLRKALGAGENGHQYIQTIARRGYRFVGNVNRAQDAATDLFVQQHSRLSLVVEQKEETSVRRKYAPQAEQAIQEKALTASDWEKRALMWRLSVVVLAVVMAAGLIAAVSYVWISSRTKRAETGIAVRSIAVLPLKNVGGDAQDEYLSDGITDELITKLTKLKSVRIVSQSVAMRYKDSGKDAVKIGRELGVDAVIHGTVRKAGAHLVLSVHLANAKDGFEIWADDNFEDDLGNLPGAERRLAEAVAAGLKGQLTAQERALVAKTSTANADAYELLLRGKAHFIKGGGIAEENAQPSENEVARQLLERAIQIDSDFADAYAWLALVLYKPFHDGHSPQSILTTAINDANSSAAITTRQVPCKHQRRRIQESPGRESITSTSPTRSATSTLYLLRH